MDVQITGKGIDLGDALQVHVREAMDTGVHKYFERGAEANVNFGKDGHRFTTEATVHLASGVFLAANGKGGDAYAAFDEAMEKLEKRVRRYKRRLKDHHSRERQPLPAEMASSYVLQGLNGADEAPEEADAPLVIAETETSLRSMTVTDAVMQLDLSDHPVIVFRNAKNGTLSVVHRRDDGNIGWIESAAKQ
ncbi:ribosome-associated translation inhibitor RaiA [Parvularcula sp. ZS-1/3]|uniref:Ribosome hibernation promoting factor n=1 Tax=Parvularcula mediterranea TaxID=2732508 RepID=A0A7Y3RKZ6_9PROT|nr:ribosome-associated translation inhibitor RaiA [Parvularcula mediterranea]NNU15991.1 ribosome-associated translation inhibitor RaiA [Parvularcula mediterranea]